MRRREFIAGASSMIAGWPIAASAQQAKLPVVGFLHSATPAPFAQFVSAFRQGLKEAGYVEGKNVLVQYSWAEGQYNRLPELAADMVSKGVSVIATTGGDPAAIAATRATKTIPVVFMVGSDPVKLGIVSSFRPRGNVTGVTFFTGPLGAKRLGILRELVPSASTVAMLVNPNNPNAGPEVAEVDIAARALGLELRIFDASTKPEINRAFANIASQKVNALLIGTDAFFFGMRGQLVAKANRILVPTIYNLTEYAELGGLVSYGASLSDNYRLTGLYAGKILAGARPTDLQILQPTTFELALNLKTAKALGITIPLAFLYRANKVIE